MKEKILLIIVLIIMLLVFTILSGFFIKKEAIAPTKENMLEDELNKEIKNNNEIQNNNLIESKDNINKQNNAPNLEGFNGPTSEPHVIGPTAPPPNY